MHLQVSSASSNGAVAEWVRALDWRPGGPWFESRYGYFICFGTLAILFTPLCQWQCLSEETLKAVGPFYLVSMPGGSKRSHLSALEMCNLILS